ncbi:hypothetical protein G7Y79_00006g018320 [Physcia stellaris]|nr:hypothetical protein G7Y79_00006g018320 [Physcia stellaris]
MSMPTDVKAGSILFLPPNSRRLYSDVVASDTETIADGLYNHPVLIFAVSRDRTRVLALILTTFGDTPIATRFPDPDPPRSNAYVQRIRSVHLPIYPASHPDVDTPLYLANNLFLKRNSYIKIEKPVILETRLLQQLHVGPRRLRTHSFKELQKRVQFTIPEGFSVANTTVSPVINPVRTQYPARLYERSVAADLIRDSALLLQNGVVQAETRMPYHGRMYGTVSHHSVTRGPVVGPSYVPPVPYNTTAAAVYRAPGHQAEEQGGRDPKEGRSTVCRNLVMAVGLFTVICVIWNKWTH